MTARDHCGGHFDVSMGTTVGQAVRQPSSGRGHCVASGAPYGARAIAQASRLHVERSYVGALAAISVVGQSVLHSGGAASVLTFSPRMPTRPVQTYDSVHATINYSTCNSKLVSSCCLECYYSSATLPWKSTRSQQILATVATRDSR